MKESLCNTRKRIMYMHLSVIIVTALVAIIIGCYSKNIISNNDINTVGMQRANILQFENLCSSLLFVLPIEKEEKLNKLTSIKNDLINTQYKLNSKYSQNPNNQSISDNITKQTLNGFRYNNFLEFSNLLNWYSINMKAPINILTQYLNTNVDIIAEKATYNSHIIIYITIGLGIIQLMGVFITIFMEYKYGDSEIELIKINTEKDIQTKLVSMLSHDLKGSATNIVGEIELIQENYKSMYEENRNKSCEMCTKNFEALQDMNKNLERGMFEAIHIQYCIKTLKMKSDILHKKYIHIHKKVKLYDIFKIFKYKFNDNIIIKFDKDLIIETNEDILYNILQNAFKNCIKHGKLNGLLVIDIEYIGIDKLKIIINNEVGKNTEKLLSFQKKYGFNWIFKEDYDLTKMGIGKIDSTFNGLVDMKILANAINGEINMNFDSEKTQFSLILDIVGTSTLEEEDMLSCNNPLDSVAEGKCEEVESEGDTPAVSKPDRGNEKLYLFGADDQPISRLFMMNIAKGLNIDIIEDKMDPKNLKGFFREEEYLKILGVDKNDFEEEKLKNIAIDWSNKKAIVVLDQNIDFTSEIIYGTDIAKLFRSCGFKGIILMRTGNDCAEEIEFYKTCGADGTISKVIKKNEAIDKIRDEWIPVLNTRFPRK